MSQSQKRKRSDFQEGTYLKRRKANTGSSITVAAQVQKAIRSAADKKYFQQHLGLTNVQTTGNLYTVTSGMIRGDGASQYSGTSITPLYLRIRYGGTSSLDYSAFRMIVFQWMDADIPVGTGILPGAGTSDGVLEFTRIENKPLMRVLYDKIIGTVPQTDNVRQPFVGTVYIPGSKLRRMRFKTGSDAPQYGAIYMLFISDDSASPSPQIAWATELCFMD